MDTLILTTDKSSALKAGAILKNGGLVAIPTETVYGLAANALDGEAVKKIFIAKGRPQDNPLIVHISALEQIDALIKRRSETLEKLAEAFWPGPLTIISEKSDRVPNEVTCGLDTVAVRFPSSGIAREIISAAGVPLAAPSANLSGSPSPTSFEHCFSDLNGRVDAIVNGPECEVGVESTVITIAGGKVRLLRPGAVTVEMLEKVVGEVEIDKAVLNQLEADAKVSSPGMKYKHYAPNAKVIILDGDFGAFSKYVSENLADGVAIVCFEEDSAPEGCKIYRWGRKADHETQARLLFDILRQTDADGMKKVFVHSPERDGIGLAVYNRLLRAAGFEVIKLD